jgi:DNA-binding NarL/FixJ family response regulator
VPADRRARGGASREIHQSQNALDAIARARRERFDLVISDINLNGPESGLDVLKAFKAAHPSGQVLLISGFGTLDTAVQAVRAARSITSASLSTSRRSQAPWRGPSPEGEMRRAPLTKPRTCRPKASSAAPPRC